jgi:hypothetical protein
MQKYGHIKIYAWKYRLQWHKRILYVLFKINWTFKSGSDQESAEPTPARRMMETLDSLGLHSELTGPRASDTTKSGKLFS